MAYLETSKRKGTFSKGIFKDGLGDHVFTRTNNDNKPGMSVEDGKFIQIMNNSLTRNESGRWEAPLPLREETKWLPNNQEDALKCLKSTRRTLDKKPLMKKHYFHFMQKLFDIRVVFDSAAETKGMSRRDFSQDLTSQMVY